MSDAIGTPCTTHQCRTPEQRLSCLCGARLCRECAGMHTCWQADGTGRFPRDHAPLETIVAEISQTWTAGRAVDPREPRPLSQQFEHVIEVNRGRGYLLFEWKLDRLSYVDGGRPCINETIVATFHREAPHG